MSVEIKYNNQNVFGNLNLPAPQFSRSASEIIYGKKRGVKESISLDGQIYIENPPTDCDYFTLLTSKRDQLLNIFSENYKTLSIEENGVNILRKDFCEIINIDFPTSSNIKIIEYSIQIECIDEEFHNEFFGVVEPKNSTSFALSEVGHYSITRSISAKGIKTSGSTSAIQNAIDFVENNSGKESVDLSIIESGLKLYLKSKTENVNRIKNSFEVTEEYIADKNDKNLDHGILIYTINSNINAGQVHEVDIGGSLDFGIDEDFNKARDRIKEIDFYSIAQKSGIQNLVTKPISSNINENEKTGKIEFSFVYNNDTTFDSCGISKEYNFSLSEVGNKITISVSGLINARGPVGKRWGLIKDKFYSEEINNIYQKAQDNVNLYFNGVTLNENYESKSIIEKERVGQISFEFAFSNKNKIENFKSFNYNISMEMSVPNVSIDMNFGGKQDHYTVSRGGFTKTVLSVSASGEYLNTTTKEQAKVLMKNKVNQVLSQIEVDFGLNSGITLDENSSFAKNKNLITLNKNVEFFDEATLMGKQT
jgi:hypothetical protein